MKTKRNVAAFALALCALAICSVAAADDPFPPEWWGNPGSIYWGWDTWHGYGYPPMLPDFGGENPPPWHPDPAGEGHAWADGPGYFHQHLNGRTWVWELYYDDQLSFVVPNYGYTSDPKYVQVQITWWSPNPQVEPSGFNVTTTDGNLGFVPAVLWARDTSDPYGWTTDAYRFEIPFNPAAEAISLRFLNEAYYVDQVVIDTLCVPEPGALALLGIAAATLGIRKR